MIQLSLINIYISCFLAYSDLLLMSVLCKLVTQVNFRLKIENSFSLNMIKSLAYKS